MEVPGRYSDSPDLEARALVAEILTLTRAIARKQRCIPMLTKLRNEARAYAGYKANRRDDPRLQPKKLG